MKRPTTSCAVDRGANHPGADREQNIRDAVVRQLARRVRPSKSTWIVHLRSSGKNSKVTIGDCRSMTVEQAREIARELLANVEAGEDATAPLGGEGQHAAEVPALKDFAPVFLADCAERWKASTLKTNTWSLEGLLLPAFGSRRLDCITREEVISWLHDPEGASGARTRALPVLSAVFDHAELRGVIPPETNPCKGLRRKRSTFKAIYLGPEAFAELGRVLNTLEAEHPTEVAMIRFMALTGCRKGEALGLTRAMIDRNRAALPDSKTGAKSLWLGRATRRLLKARPRGTDFVFCQSDGTPLTNPDLKPVWEVVRQALGLPKLRLHDLRHSFASVAITMGHDLVIVGGLLGHKDKSSTEGYVHLADKHIAAASSRVGRHLGKIIVSLPL